MKAIIVARVSTEEQKEIGNSLPAQIVRMQDYCGRKDFEIIKDFSFDESAYKEKRDEFDKLLGYIKQISKKEVTAVCFDKVDRLSRNIFDKRLGELSKEALQGNIELHFVSDHQVIKGDLSATEKGGFSMNLVMASYYSDAISDNVKRAFEQKRRNGEWTGAAPIGYLNISLDESKRLRKDIVIDFGKGPLVKKMFDLYASGNYSYASVKEEITKLGLRGKSGKVLSKSMIEKILNNSFYYGVAMPKKYKHYPHIYPCLISKDLFDKCQEIIASRRKNPSKMLSRDYMFKGLLKCQNCGCLMSPEIKIKPNGKEYIYYSCTNAKGICKREYINEKELLKPILKILKKFESITKKSQDDLVAELRKTTDAEIEFHKIQLDRIRNEYNIIKNKDNKLIEIYLEESITKNIYDKKHQEFADKLQLLEIELSEHRNADYEYQTTVASVISIARRAKDIFEKSSDVAGKRVFLNSFLQNPTVKEKKLYFSIAFPFNLVLELTARPDWLRGQDSNLRPTS